MKITKAVYDSLPDDLKAKFSPVAGEEGVYDNGEESVGALKSALEHERNQNATIKAKLDGFEKAKEKEIEEARQKALAEARSTGDFAKIEADYQRQLKELRAENERVAKEVEDRSKSEAISKQVSELSKMFVSPKVAETFIRSRLSADIVEGSVIVRVLDKDGKPSALSVEDLKKEYLTDSDLKASIVASRGAGGGAGAPPAGGGAGAVDDSKFNAATASPKDMIARLEAKGIGADIQTD